MAQDCWGLCDMLCISTSRIPSLAWRGSEPALVFRLDAGMRLASILRDAVSSALVQKCWQCSVHVAGPHNKYLAPLLRDVAVLAMRCMLCRITWWVF